MGTGCASGSQHSRFPSFRRLLSLGRPGKEFILRTFSRLLGTAAPAGCRRNNAHKGELANRRFWDKNSLRVRPGVGRCQHQAKALNQRSIVRRNPVQLFAVSQQQPQPKPCGSWPAGKTASQQALRIVLFKRGSAGRELANIANPLNRIPRHTQQLPGTVQQFQFGGIANEFRNCIPGAPIPRPFTYDNRLACGTHRLDCRTYRD